MSTWRTSACEQFEEKTKGSIEVAGATGIGDIVQSLFFSPKGYVGGWIVGAGLTIAAADPSLGQQVIRRRCTDGPFPSRIW